MVCKIFGVLAQLGEHLPYKQGVTGSSPVGPIFYRSGFADVAQLAEQLICNQQVIGSSPIIGFILYRYFLDGFPSGQRGQTVNLLSVTSVVRIHPHPLQTSMTYILPRGGAVWKLSPRYYAQIAQLVEQRTENPRVAGSIPALGMFYCI